MKLHKDMLADMKSEILWEIKVVFNVSSTLLHVLLNGLLKTVINNNITVLKAL